MFIDNPRKPGKIRFLPSEEDYVIRFECGGKRLPASSLNCFISLGVFRFGRKGRSARVCQGLPCVQRELDGGKGEMQREPLIYYMVPIGSGGLRSNVKQGQLAAVAVEFYSILKVKCPPRRGLIPCHKEEEGRGRNTISRLGVAVHVNANGMRLSMLMSMESESMSMEAMGG
jgi:hypothetical protein